jgi:hypothetical protein
MWYNGYSWNKGIDTVYNSSSLFHFMAAWELKNYWVQTGLFPFLVKEIQKSLEISSDQREFRVGEEGLYELYDSGYYGDHINLIGLMFYTGCLTVQSYDRTFGVYTLGYPNREVEESILACLAPHS